MIPVIDGDWLVRFPASAAVAAIVAALRQGLDPDHGPARSILEVDQGQLLLMPAEAEEFVGVKIVTIAPTNPAQGRPRIQGSYLLHDARTLAPLALLDGVQLTAMRTAAVSFAAIGPTLLERAEGPLHVVVFGTGPQARAHLQTLRAGHDVGDVMTLGRDARPAAVATAIRQADLVIAATTAREPLFDGAWLREQAVVVAVGSHQASARELDAATLGRGTVVVESIPTALREAGDVIGAMAEGALGSSALVPLADVVTGRRRVEAERPLVFKSVGMAWEDLVVAGAAYRAWSAEHAEGTP